MESNRFSSRDDLEEREKERQPRRPVAHALEHGKHHIRSIIEPEVRISEQNDGDRDEEVGKVNRHDNDRRYHVAENHGSHSKRVGELIIEHIDVLSDHRVSDLGASTSRMLTSADLPFRIRSSHARAACYGTRTLAGMENSRVRYAEDVRAKARSKTAYRKEDLLDAPCVETRGRKVGEQGDARAHSEGEQSLCETR